jgi:pimeloyl-ACP methyl ester carboxylesterase
VDKSARLLCLLAALALPAAAREPLRGPDVRDSDGALVKRVSTDPVVEVHDVASRDARVRVLVEKINGARAAVLLFSGSRGATLISPEGRIGRGTGNVLIRSRALLRSRGLTTVVFDGPSDEADDLRWFQDSPEFAADVGAVIAHLRKNLGVPVWLVGNSRGTISVANAASRPELPRADGVVFSSTLFVGGRWADVFRLALERIDVPTLVVHHAADACSATPPAQLAEFSARLTHARPLLVMLFEGGAAQGGDPCGARQHHGFNGIEAQVVAAIAAWIAHPACPPRALSDPAAHATVAQCTGS